MFGRMRKYFTWMLLAASTLALTACAGRSSSAQAYIATVAGGPASARVGIIVDQGRYAAYVCSLDDAFNLTSARWYSGELGPDGTFQGVSDDGVEFSGSVSGNTFAGTLVNTEQASLAFEGQLVPAGGPAGLYRGTSQYNGQDIVVGAVISPDGSFASTTQYRGRIEFVTPVDSQPERLSDTRLAVRIGQEPVQVEVDLVESLEES